MAIETLRSLYRAAGIDDLTPPSTRKQAASPYSAASNTRRAYDWNSTRLGQNTLLWTNGLTLVARSRDAIRNNAYATSAIDRFESNIIGTGIQPHWQLPNVKRRDKIQQAWNRWCKRADFMGQNDFYTLQALIAREVFEAGEVFIRHRVRPKKDKLAIPYQIQLLESEQLPIYTNIIPARSGADQSMVRLGIEFDDDYRRVFYHFYAEHPGESALYPHDSLRYVQIPSDQIQHVYRATRAGQLRGEPRMVSVLALLHEIEQYQDAALVKKKIAAMFAVFLEKPVPESMPFPPAPNTTGSSLANTEMAQTGQPSSTTSDPGVDITKLEPGTAQELLPGETVKFTSVPTEADFEPFMYATLHKFASGLGLTYEQITNDLRGVNYSSIRAGLLEVTRQFEQFQRNTIIHQACEPVMRRWLREAVIAGALDLPGYFDEPEQYEDVVWIPAGRDWVDPLKEVQAEQFKVRNGFKSRTMVVRESGYDPQTVDAQLVEERRREQDLGLTLDSNPNSVLIGRETQPTVPVEADPDPEAAQAPGVDDSATGPSKKKIAAPAPKPGALPKQGVPQPVKMPAPAPKQKPGKVADRDPGPIQ